MSQSFAVLPAFLFFDGQALSAVHLPAVADTDDDHNKLSIANRINDTPVTRANAVKVFRSGQFRYAGRSRILFKRLQPAHNPPPNVIR
jgi:hypothetical protein